MNPRPLPDRPLRFLHLGDSYTIGEGVEPAHSWPKQLLRIVEENGYTVVTADSDRKALEEFYSQSFDLVITDLRIPDGDGFKLIEEIKQRSPKIPVIAFTGKGYKSVKDFISLLRVDTLIEKTCSNETFISCVRNCLQMT